MDRIDAAIIGAGVVGLAVARALAQSGLSVIVHERADQFGTGISSRNSEVIHAGLYYPTGSLKERLCIAGNRMLYEYCSSRHVPHRRCGKLLFAAEPDELDALEVIQARAGAAGVEDLAWLEPAQVAALEPSLICAAALHSPSSGIVEAHALMLSLLGEAEDLGAMLARNVAVNRIEAVADGWRVHADGIAFACSILINAAGLGAHDVAATIDALDPAVVPPHYLAKGSYFAYSGKVPFSRLIYPVPVPGGLGTHLTIDMAGQARFGPDVEWVDEIDYTVDPSHAPAFFAAAKRIWSAIDPEKLHPAYSGIRPKLAGPGEPDADFLIQGEADHGLRGLVNLFGIESPGLTASLAIADHVAQLARGA